MHLFDHGHRHPLLIVCSDEALAKSMARAAPEDVFEITIVPTRGAALDAPSLGDYRGFIVDSVLPDATGADFVHELRGKRIQAPVLLLRSLDSPAGPREADATLTKPLSLPEYRRTVAELFLDGEPLRELGRRPQRRLALHPAAVVVPLLLGAGIVLTWWLLQIP